ncbi:MAG: hypothetical protein HOV68_12210 [Streptomycetaceae bacterium]|nr:hypothetical protein [Streptomycetaceae bacterium]NUU22258.1 hypothetical protein [Streptomycetaceae bacterium]
MGAARHRKAGTPAPRHRHLWPWRRNPLRTRAHTRHRVFSVMLLIALCAVPAVALLLGRAAYDSSAAERRDRIATIHTTQATARQDVYGGARGLLGGGDSAIPATVTWTAADGTERTGTALVDPPVRVGESTAIWLDRNGNPAHPPESSAKPVLDAVSLGVAVTLGGAGFLFLVYAAEHTLFMHSRMHAWAREWAEVAPRWTADA